jgi:hypothetical protein
MPIRALVSLVDACRQMAPWVALGAAVLTVLLGIYAAGHLSVDTDTNDLISADLPWRQREAELDNAFPQNVDVLAVVIDAATPDGAEDAAQALADRLLRTPELFRSVRRPDGGEFFQRNGLLFLKTEELQQVADDLISAQPLLGALSADPSLRGLFSALGLAMQGVEHGEVKLDAIAPAFDGVAETIETALVGRPRPLSWQTLLTSREPQPQELRRFVLVQPVLDYSALQPGKRASDAIRAAARELGLTPDRGVRVRLTGSVALSDEEFATVAEGAGLATGVSLALVCLLLFLALRSLRIIVAIVGTLLAGLVATAAFAVAAVGALNLISVAFAVLFVGIAVDFGIQFATRYRDERYRTGKLDEALCGTAAGLARPLVLAAATTAVAFYSFVPTDYSGVSELGIIAGTSMIIAILLNLTLLPALLALLRPPGERAPVGWAWARHVDDFLLGNRPLVLGMSGVLALAGLFAVTRLEFDFNPLNLKDPKTESMSTLLDLMSDPSTSPFTISVLRPDIPAAEETAQRLASVPEVAQTVTIASFVPEDQDAKLAILGDLALLLGPTLSPPSVAPPPSEQAVLDAAREAAAAIGKTARPGEEWRAPRRLAEALDQVVARGAEIVPVLHEMIISGLQRRLATIGKSLAADKVTLDTLPDDLRGAWVAADGRARVEVFPSGDGRDNDVLERFVAAVRAVAPDATGTPVSILESGRTVVDAFVKAGAIALVSISVLLFLVLRKIRDVLYVLAPLLLAALLTAATSIVIGLPLNFANIITLPLLLGIGVAFDIYFVTNWRAGRAFPLASSTARAVVFSALTTTTAFGSLALSSHPGTSEMGKLLTICLAWTVVCTLLFLPALLGPIRVKTRQPAIAAPH